MLYRMLIPVCAASIGLYVVLAAIPDLDPTTAAPSDKADATVIDFTYGNGLDAVAREDFYHLSQGSELLPIRWLRAMEDNATGRPFTTLSYANGPGYTGASPEQPEGSKHYPHVPTGYTGIHKGRPDLRRVDTTSPSYMQEATVPARADTHGGEDVPIYAGGAGAELFHGVQEQSYIYHAIVEALGWRGSYTRRP